MSTIKRYGYEQYDSGISEDPDGDYVAFDDYQKLESEAASLRATLENAADLAQEVDDLTAELNTLRALVVKKDEALQRIEELQEIVRQALAAQEAPKP